MSNDTTTTETTTTESAAIIETAAIKLDKRFRIEKACSKDQTRYTLLEPYLRDGKLHATDGRLAVIIDVPLTETARETLTDGHVPIAAIKASRRNGGILAAGCILANGKDETSGIVACGATYPRPDLGTYPKVDQVIPDEKNRIFSVSVNGDYLKRIVDAMGTPESIKIHFVSDGDGTPDCHRPITMESTVDGVNVTAVLMPQRI